MRIGASPQPNVGEDWRDLDASRESIQISSLAGDPLGTALVVLAAGLSTRYGRLKQLDPLGPSGEAIMDYNVFDAARAGFTHVRFVVRPEIQDAVRAHVDRVFGDALSSDYVCQTLVDLPGGFRPPPERRKPWGTAHAVLCAASGISGPFAVCNADDLYGPEAFQLLHEHLKRDPFPSDGVLIGYPLLETLSGAGGVARGVCHVGREGILEHVIEVRDIHRKGDWIVGVEGDETPVELTGDELVSMNLWGLSAPIVEGIRRRFGRFLDLWGADAVREFQLSTAIHNQIQTASSRVHVLHSGDPWFGLTHAEDEAPFRALLQDRIASGVYPARLATGLSERDPAR